MKEDVAVHEVICYVDRDGLTVLRCHDCGKTKAIDTNNKDYAFKTFKAKCECGASIIGRFEFRRHARKKVNLLGSYRNPKNGKIGEFEVENISLMGIGFRCFGRLSFQKGDQLDVTFTFDNPARSAVKLRVEVINIEGRFVGAKRCDTNSMQPILGFYLR